MSRQVVLLMKVLLVLGLAVQLFFVIVRGVGFIDELLPLSVIDMFIFYFCKPAGLEAPHTQGDKVLK
jgi:hypothetical protein|tara:strand:- start:217 stop:417 length:201 start_codon:yes stop_codon:yes gene_type:complete